MGAKHVLISMAGDGGLMITKDKVYRSYAPKRHRDQLQSVRVTL